jgi:HD-GYP domain-containing protein (c-di-GMP phosphodiesterase class II)
MLSSFDTFKNIAQIIKHHHIAYEDFLKNTEEEILFASHIIHLSDRVDVLIDQNSFILNQKEKIVKNIHSKVGRVFHPEVFKAFEKVAENNLFWIDINNKTLEQLFNEIKFPLDFELTIDNVLNFTLAISRIIDFRSKFTASHSQTVGQLSLLIGKILGYDQETCKKLEIAGYLHDIGKIGIDPGIIEKDGPLTDLEFNNMKLHPYYTGQILNELNSSKWFKDIIRWAENHHEKIDGNGYPHAIDKSKIDFGIKILALSDVITALMEDRPYRKGMNVEEAFKIIKEELAPNISSEMFEKIIEHKYEIDEVVQKYKQYGLNEYYSGKIN